MKIGKDFAFEAAHRLQLHNGKCRNLHGHSYRVLVSVEGPDLATEGPETGMLFDFGVLSEWWKPMDSIFDHATILEEGDPIGTALADTGVEGTKITFFPWPPTAENLALWLREDLKNWLIAHLGRNFFVHVRVYETAKSWAEA